MDAHSPGFLCGSRINGLDERHIKAAADGKTLRKNGPACKHRTMRAFFVLQNRNLEAGLCQRDLLQLIEVGDLLFHSLVQDRVCESKEAAAGADLIGVGSSGKFLARIHLFWNGSSELVHIDTGQIELSNLFLQRHATDQIIDALVNRAPWIKVDRSICGGLGE